MGGVFEEPQQPPAGDLSLLDRRQEGTSGHGRTLRRHRTGLRRERQVPLLSREHQLRAPDRLARNELRRPASHACDLSRGVERERTVTVPTGNGRRVCPAARRGGGRETPGGGESTSRTTCGPRRPRRFRPADPVAHRAGGRLQRTPAWRSGLALLHGDAEIWRRAHRAPLPGARAACRAVPGGRPLVHAFGRRQEDAVSRRWQSVGSRPY